MFRFIGKQFWKKKICLTLFMLLFLIPYAFTIWLTVCGLRGFEVIYALSRLQFYICFLWVCLTFCYLSSAEQNYVREVSGAFRRDRFVYENTALVWILVKMLAWNLGMILLSCCCAYLNDGTGYFFSWFWKSYLFNVLFPQLICVGVTYIVVIMKKQIRWFGFLLVFLFMVSPFTESVVWREQPSVAIDRIWKAIRFPFSILYQNGEWGPDTQYGLQTETVRLYIFLFWLFVISCLILSQYFRKKMVCILPGVCAAGMLLVSFLPASTYRLSQSWDGSINGDERIYAESAGGDYAEETGAPLVSYQLDLALKRELEVNCQMDIESGEAQSQYFFTLYRSYHVNEVESLTDGVQVEFSRMEDGLLITADREVDKLSVRLVYAGHHPKFYSNSEAAMLPGWFPWYPMAGKREIYYSASNPNASMREYSGYNVYNRIRRAKCQVRAGKGIITNLEKSGEGIYEGETDGITVLMGNLVETGRQDRIRDYLPLAMYRNRLPFGMDEADLPSGLYQDVPDAANTLTAVETYFDSALQTLEDQCGIDVSGLRDKKILLASKDLGRNEDNNGFAVFEDYILASDAELSALTLFPYLVMADRPGREVRGDSLIIRENLTRLSGCIQPGAASQEMAENLRDDLQWTIDYSEEAESVEVAKELQRLLNQSLDEQKTDILIQGLIDYMLHPDVYGGDAAFMQEMEGRL